MEIVRVHKRPTLIILPRDVSNDYEMHLTTKLAWLKLLPRASSEDGLRTGGAVGATMNRSGAVSSSSLAIDVCAVADSIVCESCRCSYSFSSS